jgi:D-threonate/D-erythronate kinase
MNRALVIADDLTGAAEIAAIGWRYGLPTRLVRRPVARCDAGLTVLDTDSRLLPPADAADVVLEFVKDLRGRDFDLVYKKTDSVLRGPVRAELEALRAAFRRPTALLVPQNPSRGRVIDYGQYLIDGTPLHETAFAEDPDYPAATSDVGSLLGPGSAASCIALGDAVPQTDIVIGAAVTSGDVRQWAARAGVGVLPAGGADFFGAILEHLGLTSAVRAGRLDSGKALFVCGSASAGSRAFVDGAAEQRVPICAMPAAVFHASDASALAGWTEAVCAALASSSHAVMAIQHPVERRPGFSRRVETAMAEAAARVLERVRVANLLAEGGATASAVCRRMGWETLNVAGELVPGVVQLRVADATAAPTLCVKPGSYPWPASVAVRMLGRD